MENRVTISPEERDDLRNRAKTTADETAGLADEKSAEHEKVPDDMFAGRHEDDVGNLELLESKVRDLERRLGGAKAVIARQTEELNDMRFRRNSAIAQFIRLQDSYEQLVRRGLFARIFNLGI